MKAVNFGDLLSPWLFSQMTGREVVYADPSRPHYVAIGSILKQANAQISGLGSRVVRHRGRAAVDAARRRTPPCAARCHEPD